MTPMELLEYGLVVSLCVVLTYAGMRIVKIVIRLEK